jgi:hypothetical protein
MSTAKSKTAQEDRSIENNLTTLYALQQIDTRIDQIVRMRGELPMEVEDLEDEIAGLETRIENLSKKVSANNAEVLARQHENKEAEALVAKYQEQINHVSNNREYESLTKEIAYQQLETELRDKQSKDFRKANEQLQAQLAAAKEKLAARKNDLEVKRGELDTIIEETSQEQAGLEKEHDQLKMHIPERLLKAYMRIRQNAHNGLAVVTIERDSCGGCFNRIPPQRQLDIRMYKRLIVCEYCGRIIVDTPEAKEEEATPTTEKAKETPKTKK